MTHEEPKHTPAPWHHSPELSRSGCELVYAGDKHLVANVGSFSRSDETNRANARLIAAAPELLEELENAVFELEQWMEVFPSGSDNTPDVLRKARKAIRKARAA